VPDRLEARLVPEAGFRLHHVDAVSIPRRPVPALLRVPGRCAAASAPATGSSRRRHAVGAVTFGGYVSFPVDRAAFRRQLPLVLHEQNAIPGLANRVAARWADRVAVTFPVPPTGSGTRSAAWSRAIPCARRSSSSTATPAPRGAGAVRAAPDVPDRCSCSAAARVPGRSTGRSSAPTPVGGDDLQILHAAGRVLYDEALEAWQPPVPAPRPAGRAVDFIDDMADAYAAADVVVCRAGATSIAELTCSACRPCSCPTPTRPATTRPPTPAPSSTPAGAVVVPDDDLDAAALRAAVEPLLTDPLRYDAMAAASRAFGRPDAATNVARLVLEQLDDDRT
jgi:UDP-N-acetylglucosamine--N-acetylmuramyl-(pentapeptide) pyrophosphoryl-undecaprenol N-acetylglucosamine transferase